MLDGTYKVEVDTPFGRKPGTVALRSEGDVVYANMEMPVIGKQDVAMQADGDGFSTEGEFKVRLLGKVAYTLHGEVEGDNLHIEIDSSKGKLELDGTRV
ncbi:MAG: hypothetical protein IKG21_01965 [Atopobiaceae bacterium]|nr:hypothetical protein [Atopobiaceae bacterium]